MKVADRPVVHSRTIEWEQPNLLNFLRRANGEPRFYWESERSGLACAGFGIVYKLTADGDNRYDEIRRKIQSVNTAGYWLGGFSFSEGPPSSPASIWHAFPQACFILPKYLLTRRDGVTRLTISVTNDDPYALDEALWNLPAPESLASTPGISSPSETKSAPEIHDLTQEKEWQTLVEDSTSRIRSGEFGKVVLARARELHTTDPVDPLLVLGRLAVSYPGCYRFLFEPRVGSAFYGATPELLAGVSGQTLETMALAGSIRRGQTLDEDENLGQTLLHREKEHIEHDLVREEIRQNLAGLAGRLKVDDPGLLQLSNIQHVCSRMSGNLNPSVDILSVIEALHPTPAVGGVPQKDALAYIEQHEPVSRGWYASPLGWLTPEGDGEFAVALRSAISVGTRTRLYAGAGIVADSDPESEWREIELKFRPMMEAIL